MTTDDQKLTEQIAQKLHEVDPISGHDPRWDRLLKMDREWYRIKATAVLPILRRAQAEAWDEGQMSAEQRAEQPRALTADAIESVLHDILPLTTERLEGDDIADIAFDLHAALTEPPTRPETEDQT